MPLAANGVAAGKVNLQTGGALATVCAPIIAQVTTNPNPDPDPDPNPNPNPDPDPDPGPNSSPNPNPNLDQCDATFLEWHNALHPLPKGTTRTLSRLQVSLSLKPTPKP